MDSIDATLPDNHDFTCQLLSNRTDVRFVSHQSSELFGPSSDVYRCGRRVKSSVHPNSALLAKTPTCDAADLCVLRSFLFAVCGRLPVAGEICVRLPVTGE